MADAQTAPERAAPRLILEVVTSSLAGRRFAYTIAELRKGVILGRAADCTVRFDSARDPKVSGHHALIEERVDGIFVRDQGSANGLYLNRQRVTPEGLRLYDGDEIHLGQEGACVRTVIAGEPRPTVQVQPAAVAAPAAPTAVVRPVMPDAPTHSLTRMVENIGAKVGAGDKTKHLLKAVAQELEQRQSRKTGTLVTLVIALFMLLAAAGAVGVWYYMQGEESRVAAEKQAAEEAKAALARRDEADKRREADKQKELDEMRKQLGGMMAKQEKLAEDLRAEQSRRFDEMKREVGDETAQRVKEISDAQFKTFRAATDEQLKDLKNFTLSNTDGAFRELVEKYNPSVFLIFVQYPLLNDKDEAVGVESGTGTGWVAKIGEGKAWIVTNKHVIKPYVFKPELAISHAIQNVKPAPFDQWTIACWQPGMRLRDKVGSSALNVADAWATVPGGRGGKGLLKVAGFADDDLVTIGDEVQDVLKATGFKTDLPDEVIDRVKLVSFHKDTPNDLAVLEFTIRDKADLTLALPMATEEELKGLHQMDRVMSLGYPLGLSVIQGTMVTTSPATGDIRSLQFEVGKIGTSAPVLPGNSGGPLIDGHGRVLGVITRRFEATQAEAIAVTHARALVDKLAK